MILARQLRGRSWRLAAVASAEEQWPTAAAKPLDLTALQRLLIGHCFCQQCWCLDGLQSIQSV